MPLGAPPPSNIPNPLPVGGYASDFYAGLPLVPEGGVAPRLTNRKGVAAVGGIAYGMFHAPLAVDGSGGLLPGSASIFLGDQANNFGYFPMLSVPNSFTPKYTPCFGYVFNGQGWDRERGNEPSTLLASAARTATVVSSDQTNFNHRGLIVFININNAGLGSITATIEGKDQLSNVAYPILSSAALLANGLTVLRVYPGLPDAMNAKANDLLPRIWRVTVTHNNANAITYSVGASLLL